MTQLSRRQSLQISDRSTLIIAGQRDTAKYLSFASIDYFSLFVGDADLAMNGTVHDYTSTYKPARIVACN